jgi:peptidoglycan hydrolase CwlO-like protein
MNLSDIKSELKRGIKAYEAFKAADDIIKALDGAEQATREELAKREKLAAGNAEAQASLEFAKGEANKIMLDAKALQGAAQDKAAELVEAAKVEAAGLLAKAKADAADMEAKTKAAASHLSSMEAAASEAAKELAALHDKKEKFLKSLK